MPDSLKKKDIQSLIFSKIKNQPNTDEIALTVTEILIANGGLPQSYNNVGAYLTKNKPFWNACTEIGYEPTMVCSSTGNKLHSGGLVNWQIGLASLVVLKKQNIATPTTVNTPTTLNSAANSNLIDYDNDYGYTAELRDLMSRGLTVVGNSNKPIVEMTQANINVIDPLLQLSYPNRMLVVFNYYCIGGRFPWNNREAVSAVVRQIAIDNSTRTSATVRDIMVEYIMQPANNFPTRVFNGDIGLVDELLSYVQSRGGRREKSLASKVCKYFNNMLGKDDYYINDLFIRSMLPYYLDFYNIPHALNSVQIREAMCYTDLFNYLEAIRNKTPLSRNLVDRIIWFSYKSYPAKG